MGPFAEVSHYLAWLDVYIAVGWMVGTVKPIRTQGRSVVFVDDKLNSAAIRVYNEQNPSGDVTPPFVEEAAREIRCGTYVWGLKLGAVLGLDTGG